MAKLQINMPDDFALKLSQIERAVPGITEKVVEAGGEAAVKIAREELDRVVGDTKYESRSTGELQASLGMSPVGVDKKGMVNVKIGFREPRRHRVKSKGSVTNAMIATVIEHGKSGQPAKPFMARARKKALRLCRQVMIKTFEEEASKI